MLFHSAFLEQRADGPLIRLLGLPDGRPASCLRRSPSTSFHPKIVAVAGFEGRFCSCSSSLLLVRPKRTSVSNPVGQRLPQLQYSRIDFSLSSSSLLFLYLDQFC